MGRLVGQARELKPSVAASGSFACLETQSCGQVQLLQTHLDLQKTARKPGDSAAPLEDFKGAEREEQGMTPLGSEVLSFRS